MQAFGEQIAVGIDAKNGQVAVKGWVATADMSALALAKRMDVLGVRTLIHTDIGTDGMLTGPNFPAQEAMLDAGKFRVIASGGVSRRDDVVKLAELARRYSEPRWRDCRAKRFTRNAWSLPDLLASSGNSALTFAQRFLGPRPPPVAFFPDATGGGRGPR